MRILFKFPTRERPAKFFEALNNIQAMASSDNYSILATLDADDATMNNSEVIYRICNVYGSKVLPMFGNSTSKVHAINRDVENICNWDILCLHSDDMFFTKKGFDLDIIAAMTEHFPDTDGMLHFPDQKTREKLCTYQIVGRKYYERSGYIYNPEFTSLWADNEEMEKAQMLGKYAFIDKQILEHRHPFCGFGKPDALLKRTESFYRHDKAIYLRHKAENFGIK